VAGPLAAPLWEVHLEVHLESEVEPLAGDLLGVAVMTQVDRLKVVHLEVRHQEEALEC